MTGTSDSDHVPAEWRGRTAIVRVPEGYRVLLVVKGKAIWHRTFIGTAPGEAEEYALSAAGERISQFLPDGETWLHVPYAFRQEAVAKGAWFNPDFSAFVDPNPGFRSKLNRFTGAWEKERRRKLIALRKERNAFLAPGERFYLCVPYPQIEQASAAGALFDRQTKKWYTSRTDSPELLTDWIPQGKNLPGRRTYACPPGFIPYPRVLYISAENESFAKSRGALFWKEAGLWISPAGMPEGSFDAEARIPVFDGPELACIAYMNQVLGCAPETVYFDGLVHTFGKNAEIEGPFAYRMWCDGLPGGWIVSNLTKQKYTWHFESHGLFWNADSFPPYQDPSEGL